MNDLINRQTAIERIRGQMIHGVACGKEIQEYYEGLSCAVNILAGLPSAEPEQTKMIKEIRKWINSGNRGKADYFIVDKIEEIIRNYE